MITPSDRSVVMRFYRTFIHILIASDIDFGYLVIAWFGFSEDALMLKTANWLSSIDHYGSIWRCEMVFIMVDNTLFCSIGGDWKSFCEARNLVKGHAIKLGATENTTSGILHIRHVS